jgi:predicted Fe-S protein YdhL (DUF1289 family)
MNDPVHIRLLEIAAEVKGQTLDDPIPSPCISVCQMDVQSGLCLGCWRSMDEIARWGGASRAYQRSVWRCIEARIEGLLA